MDLSLNFWIQVCFVSYIHEYNIIKRYQFVTFDSFMGCYSITNLFNTM